MRDHLLSVEPADGTKTRGNAETRSKDQIVPKSRPHPSKVHAAKAPVPVPVKKAAHSRQGFRTHEHIVYPAHGVGQIVRIEEQEIAGNKLELFVISFAKDKMTLRVPTSKAASVGMRKLAGPDIVQKSLDTLKGRA